MGYMTAVYICSVVIFFHEGIFILWNVQIKVLKQKRALAKGKCYVFGVVLHFFY